MFTSPDDFNAQIIEEFRANDGRVYHNLKAHPDASIEVGTDTIDFAASEATGEERDRLYKTQAERVPQFAEYQKGTDRLIPVMVLTPANSA